MLHQPPQPRTARYPFSPASVSPASSCYIPLHLPIFRSRSWEVGLLLSIQPHTLSLQIQLHLDLPRAHIIMLGLNTTTNMLRQAPKLIRGLSTSAVRNDVSRMILVGRLANTPDVRQTTNGNEYAVYTVATRDPSRPTNDPQNATSSYHRIFAFGDSVNRVRRLFKGSPVYVEADFRVERVHVTEDKISEKIFTNHRMFILPFFLISMISR